MQNQPSLREKVSFLGRSALLASCLLAVGCTGAIDPKANDVDRSGRAPDVGSAPVQTPGRKPPGDPAPSVPIAPVDGLEPAPMRRLTRADYRATVRQVFGVDLPATVELPPDESVAGFSVLRIPVERRTLEQIQSAAVEVATAALRRRESWLSCATARECGERFAAGPARLLFRRTLGAREREALIADIEGAPSIDEGLGAATEYVLQSPHFLYLVERGRPGGGVDARTIASRLATFLWRGVPDAALLDAAEAGRLATPAARVEEATRMLASPLAEEGIGAFFEQWLGLEHLDQLQKDPLEFPGFDEGVRRALRADVRRFGLDATRSPTHALEALFTAEKAFAPTPALAAIYGLARPDAAVVQAPPAGQRSGVLTLPAVLATYSGPAAIQRGLFLIERVLCGHMATPPVDAAADAPPPARTEREWLALHRKNPTCDACHRSIDGMGLGLSNFDVVGRFMQTTPAGPVDATGAIYFSGNVDGPYDGHRELGARLARSTAALDCQVTQWLRYALGREETPADRVSIEGARSRVSGAKATLADLVLAVVDSPAFESAAMVKPQGGK